MVTVQFACREAGQSTHVSPLSRVLGHCKAKQDTVLGALEQRKGLQVKCTVTVRVVHARKRLITQPGGIPTVPNALLKEE